MQMQTAGSGFDEGFELAVRVPIAEGLQGSANQTEVNSADDVGILVGGAEQGAASEPDGDLVLTGFVVAGFPLAGLRGCWCEPQLSQQ